MSRIKRGVNAVKKRRKILKLAKGYFGAKSKQYRIARQAVMKSLNYAYVGRKLRKRDFRQLWIARINAAARLNDMSYSTLMYGLSLAKITLNRKSLSEIAIGDPTGFSALANKARSAIGSAKRAPVKAAQAAAVKATAPVAAITQITKTTVAK
jgi:large subunit ribosomal protein L20